MKNGKKPTVAQSKMITAAGFHHLGWLIVKDTPTTMVILNRETGEIREIAKT